nr:hypothetical protein [uncultured Paludibaculum sp.]
MSGATSQLTLQNETAQIDRLLLLSQSRTLIEGHMNGSVSIITVLDNSSGQVLGSLLCFVPSVSPDGTWLAYVKVYPLHFTDVSNEYYVANLNQRFVKGSIPPSHDNRIPIGQRIYPATADEGEHSWGSNKLFWVGAQNTLAFGDHWKGENQLVIADLRGHRAAPKVSVHRLESRLYVKESSCEEYRGRFGRAFFIGGVEPSGQGPSGVSVRLVFNDAACVLDEHISVDGVM